MQVTLDKLGISAEDVLAIGDAPNDISMFEYVGHSIAFGGSFEELAAVADVVSPFPLGDTFKPLVDSILS